MQQLIYEYDTKLQLQKAEAQARERRIQIIGAALLVIGLLTICYLIYSDKKKRQMLQAQQQLAQAEAKISTLKMALTDRNKALEELRLSTLHMARMRFAQTEIYQKVVQLAQKEEGEQMLPVLSHTDRGKLSQEVFNLFSDFIREQQEEYPTLTDNDLLYLCLQESNFSNRAIAIGMGYSDLSGVRHSNHVRLRSIISYIIIKMFLYTSIITSVPLESQRIFRVCLINRIPHSRSNGMIF